MIVRVNEVDYNINFVENGFIVNNIEKKVEIKDKELIIEGKKFYLDYYEEGENESLLIINGMAFMVSRKLESTPIIKDIKSPMNGQITDILVQIGSEIMKGQSLVIVEAMKMYNEIKSTRNGVVKDILVQKRQPVKAGDIILILE